MCFFENILNNISIIFFSAFCVPRNKNNNNFLLRLKYIKFHLDILPCNNLLSHFHYINRFISYKIANYYIPTATHQNSVLKNGRFSGKKEILNLVISLRYVAIYIRILLWIANTVCIH